MSAVVIRPGDTVLVTVEVVSVEELRPIREALEATLPECKFVVLAGCTIAGVYRADGTDQAGDESA